MNLNKGLSGCVVELTEKGNLIKYSSGASYNYRLIIQAKKQNFFSKIIFKNLSVPRVLKITDDKELSSFEMEYAFGSNLGEFLDKASRQDLEFVRDTFLHYFDTISENSRMYDAKNQVVAKIKSLTGRASKYELFLEELLAYVELHPNFIIPETICHGDLTLSNVIFNKNRLFMIDFLDSYLKTFLCDLAKLKQDMFYLWTPSIENNCSLRTVQSLSYMWSGIEDRFGKIMEERSFQVIDVLNILRIEPYIRNEKQSEMVDTILKKTTLYENLNCADGRKII
jgi:hypothetical protein